MFRMETGLSTLVSNPIIFHRGLVAGLQKSKNSQKSIASSAREFVLLRSADGQGNQGN